MRILVTGGCGFLGGAFAVRARGAGHAVTTLDLDGAADLVCDMGDPGAVGAAVAAVGPEVVVHLAAALTDAAAADAVAATRVNALGTAALFSACVAGGVGRVVYASSVAAVGPCAAGSGDGVRLAPSSVYGATKAFGEHLARAMAGGTGFLALRFGWVYGPGRVRGWRVAQELVERFAAGEGVVVYPEIPGVMDWTYVDDAVAVLMGGLDCPLEGFAAYNVVGDLRGIGDAVGVLRGRFPGVEVRGEVVEVPPSGWGLRNDGLMGALGVVPGVGLEEGIGRLLGALEGGRAV